jgi:hypothetical protein
LAFFFGALASLASFGVDAVAPVLVSGSLAARHHHVAIRVGFLDGRQRYFPGGWARAGNIAAPWGSVV